MKDKDTNNLVTFMALRVFNLPRSSMLIRRFRRTKVWTLPIIEFGDSDPVTHIDEALEELSIYPNFEMTSAIPIITLYEEDSVWDDKINGYTPKLFRSVIYDLQYSGFVCLSLPEDLKDRYDRICWVKPKDLVTVGKLNRPTSTLVKMMEKEVCLR